MEDTEYTTAIYKNRAEYKQYAGFSDSIGVRHHRIVKEEIDVMDSSLLEDSIFNLLFEFNKIADSFLWHRTLKRPNTQMLSSLSIEELYALEHQLIVAHTENNEYLSSENYESINGTPMNHFTLGVFCYYYSKEENENTPEYRVFVGDSSHKDKNLYLHSRMHDFANNLTPYGVLMANEIQEF